MRAVLWIGISIYVVLLVAYMVYSFHTYGCFAKGCPTLHKSPLDVAFFVITLAVGVGLVVGSFVRRR